MPTEIRISQFPSIATSNILDNFYLLAVRRNESGAAIDNVKITLDQIFDIIQIDPSSIVIPNGTPDDLTLVTENGELVLKAYNVGGGSSTLSELNDVIDQEGSNLILVKGLDSNWVATQLDLSLLPSITVNRTGTTFTADASWGGRYNRFTSDGNKNLTLPGGSSNINLEFHINLIGEGSLILVPEDVSVIINSTTLTFEQGSVLTIKKIATGQYDVIAGSGDTNAPQLDATDISFVDNNTELEGDNVSEALINLQIDKINLGQAIFPMIYNVTPDDSPITTDGAGVFTARVPMPFYLTGVRASLTSPQVSGSSLQIDVLIDTIPATDTPINIENGDTTSRTSSIQPSFVPRYIEDDTEIKVDIVQVGDGTASGLKVYLVGHRIEIVDGVPIIPPLPEI